MHKTYTTTGTCSKQIDFDIDNEGKIRNLHFLGGCSGNTQGIASLCEGMNAEDAAKRLKGICCGTKGTSCPDQLAIALEAKHQESITRPPACSANIISILFISL